MTDRGVEIRCVVGKLDGWEVVSSRRCCIFEWERWNQSGIIYVEPKHCAECRHEVFYYAVERGYRICERRSR